MFIFATTAIDCFEPKKEARIFFKCLAIALYFATFVYAWRLKLCPYCGRRLKFLKIGFTRAIYSCSDCHISSGEVESNSESPTGA